MQLHRKMCMIFLLFFFTSGRLVKRSSAADGKLMRLWNEVVVVPREKSHTAHTIQGKMYVKILLNFYTWNELYIYGLQKWKIRMIKFVIKIVKITVNLLSYIFSNRRKIRAAVFVYFPSIFQTFWIDEIVPKFHPLIIIHIHYLHLIACISFMNLPLFTATYILYRIKRTIE